MSISKKTLDHPVLTLIVFVLLLIMGLFTLKNVAISLMPDVDSPYITVRTSYTNAGPESVEKSVTKVLEGQLVSVSGLKNLTSTSSSGSSSISLEFNYGTDLDAATNDIRDKISRVTRNLPSDAGSPTIFKMDSDSMPIMRIAVRGNRSNDDLKQIAEDQIIDLFEQVDGVAEASVSGGRTKIVRVDISQNRLAAYGLTMANVYSALGKQNLELGGGKITEGTHDYTIRTVGEFSSIDEVNDTIITTLNGYGVKLSDIGTAYLGYKDKSSEVYINGQPGIYVSITKQSGKNTVTVAKAAREKMAEIQEILPSDMRLEIIRDSSTSINDTINTLIESAYTGLILAVIILFLFLKSGKSTMIIAISIPLSIVITLLCMNFAGITLNMMTLTGLILGVGMIVDASIVMIENIYVYRSRGAKPKVAAVLGSQEMVMSVISGNLTTICVFVPFLFFIKNLGMMGQMFKGIIFTVVIALVSSLFVAIFLVPVLAGKFFPLTNRKEKPVSFKPLRRFYELLEIPLVKLTGVYRKALNAALSHRLVTCIVCVSVLLMSIVFIPTLRIQMMTGGGDDSVTMNLTMPIGTTLSETTAVLKTFERICEEEIKGYTTLITSIGTGGGNTSYKGSIQINLPSSDEQIDTAESIQKKLRAHFGDFTDARFSFSQGYMRQMTGSSFKLKIRSDDLDSALKVASQVRGVMESIPDIGEVSIDTEEGLPEVEIEIDRQRAYSFGVDVTTVAKEINYAINGVTATTYRQDGKEYSMILMYQKGDRQSVADLEQIYVNGSKGKVSVANFAKVVKGLGPVSIRRANQTRVVTVSADNNGKRNDYEVESDIKEGIASTFIIPDGVTISYEGNWKDTQEQGQVYGLIILMAILLVFGVMAGTYESFKAPFINLMTIPFLIIGVVFVYKLTGQAFSMMSAVGLIMLVGIVVNNGIILVDYTNLLIDRGYKMKEACLEAGASRLRPVLMTTLTTILGMIPMCFATSGSAGMVQPIGVAVAGGLTSSTFITLFFIPVLYSLMMKERKQNKSKIKILLTEDNNHKD
ncbi:efflux RND transporter permease subunit [uncultured Treponema sp.]|uniref:efflux RND transporter permease subunit n=1 Tax=uncultured Treponema sp. TaxID=162155 RepID=UPI0025CE52E7|nr:efflux RND transporter permease subunit [uncultured Treponema sp.]